MKNKIDKAVKIAKSVTAGICSSDADDDFDSRGFSDGFTGKLKKKLGEYVDGIHAGDAIMGDRRVPYVFFPDNYTGEFTDGSYIGKFSISYNPRCEADEFQFCIVASLIAGGGEKQQTVWNDKYCYSMHVKSFSGERAVLNKTPNAFTAGNIGDFSIMTLLKGGGVIDEYGVDNVPKESDAGDIAKSNHDFLIDEMGKLADRIKKKISAWIDDNKIISVISSDVNDEVSQNERSRKGIQ